MTERTKNVLEQLDEDDLAFTFEDLKSAISQATGDDKQLLKQLARGLRPVEIESLPRSSYDLYQIHEVFREHVGEEYTLYQCRHALFVYLAKGKTSKEDAALLLNLRS